jgi:hypothetical protein
LETNKTSLFFFARVEAEDVEGGISYKVDIVDDTVYIKQHL